MTSRIYFLSYNNIPVTLKKLKIQTGEGDELMDMASIIWHIKSLADELAASRQQVERLVPI
jgi:hypothetical protein